MGTNRENLIIDPMYIGNRHARIRGERYDAFIDAYVKAAKKLFPKTLLQWEDFAPGNARRILERHRERICTFNEDIQGMGGDHAGGSDFRRSCVRNTAGQPTRGDFLSRYSRS